MVFGPAIIWFPTTTNTTCTLELTVCHETNVVSSRDYKRDKYKNIAYFRSALAGNRKVYSHTIKISTLGFISNITDFTKLIGVSHMPIHVKQEIISTVLKCSFAIYSNMKNAAMIDDV